MSKTIYKKIAIITFLAMLVAPAALRVLGIGADQGQLNEKRTLAGFPTAYSDTISNDISTWFADNAPYRENAIERDNRFAQISNTYYFEGMRRAIRRIATPSWYKYSDGQEYYPLFEKNGAVYGRQNWLFYESEDNLQFFKGSNNLNKKTMNEWRAIFEELNAICNRKGIKMVIMAAPNKEQVYPEHMASINVKKEIKREELFYEFMRDSEVTYLYPLDEMIKAKERFDTYYQQDTHWNLYGAYVGAKCIYDILGIQAPSIGEIPIHTEKKTGGDLSDMCGYATEYNAPVIDYKKDVEVNTETYDNIEVHRSTANTGRDIVVVSDSYRLAIRDYLARDFDSCITLHRIALGSDIAKDAINDLKEGDVLVLLAVERYDVGNIDAAKAIIDILK